MNFLISRNGETKSIAEWKAECSVFYNNLKTDYVISGQWERFSKILGLQPIGYERTWDGRKQNRINKEGLTRSNKDA